VAQAVAQRDGLSDAAINAEVAQAQARVAAAEAEDLRAHEAHEQTMKCHNVALPDGGEKQVCPQLGPIEEQARQNLHAASEALAAAKAQLSALATDAEQRQAPAQARVDGAQAQQDVAHAQLELL
jgi:hypothetical protein